MVRYIEPPNVLKPTTVLKSMHSIRRSYGTSRGGGMFDDLNEPCVNKHCSRKTGRRRISGFLEYKTMYVRTTDLFQTTRDTIKRSQKNKQQKRLRLKKRTANDGEERNQLRLRCVTRSKTTIETVEHPFLYD